VVPSAIETASVMFDDKIVSQIKAVPYSDNTVQRRTVEMATDVNDQVVEKIVLAKQFALQLDESTDISNEAELVAFVRVLK
jgi:isochorismate synthase EntC